VFIGNTFESDSHIFKPYQKMGNRREYIEKMAAKLKDLESEIQELEVLADKAMAEVKAEYQEQINELFLKKEAVQNKLLKIREVTGNAWEDMKAGAELSWEVFNESAKSAFKKIK
jgi:phage host-nuclease inhibitor protein Gam